MSKNETKAICPKTVLCSKGCSVTVIKQGDYCNNIVTTSLHTSDATEMQDAFQASSRLTNNKIMRDLGGVIRASWSLEIPFRAASDRHAKALSLKPLSTDGRLP